MNKKTKTTATKTKVRSKTADINTKAKDVKKKLDKKLEE